MNDLIEANLNYAHALAAELVTRYPSVVTRGDLESAAELGLVQAARSYDTSRGISFATFAYYRIRGAMFDEIRQNFKASRFEAAANDCITDLTESPSASHARAGEVVDQLKHATSRLLSNYLLSLDALNLDHLPDKSKSPAKDFFDEEEAKQIKQALQKLPERHRFVLHSYYYQDQSFETIGKHLGLSRSWVSRLHGKALSLLAERLRESQASWSYTRPEPLAKKNVIAATSASGPR